MFSRYGDAPLDRFKTRSAIHPWVSQRIGQEGSHGETFVEKETDETSRLGHRQCAGEPEHRLILFALGASRDRLKDHHLELLILPILCLHQLSPCREHRQCCGWVSLSQVDSGLDERELVCLSQMGCR